MIQLDSAFTMETAHFKYGQCENCGLAIEKVGALQVINFWQLHNSRLIPYYLYVCDGCYESRGVWCQHLFPDNCEICRQHIEDGEQYLEKKMNGNNEPIASFGLLDGEKCRIICADCNSGQNQ